MVDPSDDKRENDIDIPILIIGGGPTGLLLAHLLSELGGQYSLSLSLSLSQLCLTLILLSQKPHNRALPHASLSAQSPRPLT
jgi:NADH dehydrogenase FAD-containing subunit